MAMLAMAILAYIWVLYWAWPSTWSGQFGSERLIWDHERFYTWKINWLYIRKRKFHIKKSSSLRIYSITTINSILSVVIETWSTKTKCYPSFLYFSWLRVGRQQFNGWMIHNKISKQNFCSSPIFLRSLKSDIGYCFLTFFFFLI